MKIGHADHFLNEALEKDIGHLFYFYIDIYRFYFIITIRH